MSQENTFSLQLHWSNLEPNTDVLLSFGPGGCFSLPDGNSGNLTLNGTFTYFELSQYVLKFSSPDPDVRITLAVTGDLGWTTCSVESSFDSVDGRLQYQIGSFVSDTLSSGDFIFDVTWPWG